MEGAARRAKREHDARITEAWHTAAFNAATKGKRGLQPLDTYLNAKPKPKQQSAADMLAVLQSIKAGGAAMSIRRVN